MCLRELLTSVGLNVWVLVSGCLVAGQSEYMYKGKAGNIHQARPGRWDLHASHTHPDLSHNTHKL